MNLHDFHFLRPLWLLALVPLLVALWRLAAHRDEADSWRRLVDPHLLPHVLVGEKNTVRRLPLTLLGLGWMLAVVALAGPVWARLPHPVYQATAYRVLALDLSPSMDATDLRPSRLTHARFKVLDMLKRAQEGQTALLAYGVEPYVVSPLTSDARTIEAQVPSLKTQLLPIQGPKNTALALRKAGELLRQAGAPEGAIILITDGLAQPALAEKAAAALHHAGYRVSVLGVGTSEGAPIPLPDGGFLKDGDGSIVLSKLDPGVLKGLAAAGGGRYATASLDDSDVTAVIGSVSPALSAEPRQSDARSDTWREEGPWLLLALLPLAALGFRRGWLSVALLGIPLLAPPPVAAFSWSNLWLRPDQQAARAMTREDYPQAAKRFERPDWRAAAEYAAGDYEQALQTLGTVDDAAVHYNRANALAKLGRLEQAVAEYDRALAANPDDEDARHNRDLVRKLLRERRERPPQNPQDRPQVSPPQRKSGDSKAGQSGQGDNQPGETKGDTGHPQNARQQSEPAPLTGQKSATKRAEQASSEQQPKSAEDTPSAGASKFTGAEKPKAASSQPPTGSRSQRPEDRSGQPPESSLGQQQPSEGHEPGVADLLGRNPAPSNSQTTASLEKPSDSETRQALEQMLRRVPDDPAGLLRQRFLLQHLRRAGRLP